MDNTTSQSVDTSTPVESTTTPEAVSAPVGQDASQPNETQTTGTGVEATFDPNTIPEELKPAYKQMQADYTKKTQAIAEERKQAETWKQQAEQFSKYQSYVPILEEMLKPKEGLQVPERPEIAALEKQLKEQGYSKDAIDLAKSVAKQTLDSVTQTFTQKEQVAQQQAEQARLTSQIAEASKVDPRITDASLVYETPSGKLTYGQIVERMVATDPNWQKDVITATKNAVAVVDSLIGKAKTEGKMELSASAKAKATKFPQVNSSPQTAKAENQSYSSMRDAAADAKRALGM